MNIEEYKDIFYKLTNSKEETKRIIKEEIQKSENYPISVFEVLENTLSKLARLK